MALIIPTIFTAMNQLSRPVMQMQSSLLNFSTAAQTASVRAQASFNSLLPTVSKTTDEMLSMAKGAVGVTAAIGGLAFAGKSLMDYQDALASFRTIVSDLNDLQFGAFKSEIANVATATRKSTVDVANSFEKIAGLNPMLAATASGLGDVSRATITLAKASHMELGPAAESLVGIMNQFGLGASQANRAINVLAAGQAVGAASIMQSTEALTNFGAVAKAANLSIEQSIGLIQTLAGQGQVGPDVGNRLRTTLLKIQETGLGYGTGKFNLNEAIEGIQKRYNALGTEQMRNAYLSKIFGENQILTGTILVKNSEQFKSLTQQVTGTNEAMRAADINSTGLRTRLDELRNAFVTQITTNTLVNGGLDIFGGLIKTITNNMGVLVTAASLYGGTILLLKTRILALQGAAWLAAKAQYALNFAEGVGTVITQKYATACFATTAGMNGMAAASFFLEAGLLGSLGIIGLAAGAVALLSHELLHGYDSSVDYVGQLQKMKNGLYEISKPLSDLQIKQQQYNKAVEDYRNLQQYAGFIKAETARGGTLAGAAASFEMLVKHPTMAMAIQREMAVPGINAPTYERYGLDSTGTNELAPATPSFSTSNTYDNKVTVNVHVDKNGTVSAEGKNVTGMVPVEVNQTGGKGGRYW